jgi:hypothetical protein
LSSIARSCEVKAPAPLRWGFLSGSPNGTARCFHAIFTKNHAIDSSQGNITCADDLVLRPSLNGNEAELDMNIGITDNSEQIDRKTSRSICDGIGERLRQDLRPDALGPSSYLQHLMDELRRRDSEDRHRASN